MDWNNISCSQCGLINDYSIEVKSGQQVCNCNGCGKFLGNKPYPFVYEEMRMPFGKYDQELIHKIDDIQYLNWFYDNVTKCKGNVRAALKVKLGRK